MNLLTNKFVKVALAAVLILGVSGAEALAQCTSCGIAGFGRTYSTPGYSTGYTTGYTTTYSSGAATSHSRPRLLGFFARWSAARQARVNARVSARYSNYNNSAKSYGSNGASGYGSNGGYGSTGGYNSDYGSDGGVGNTTNRTLEDVSSEVEDDAEFGDGSASFAPGVTYPNASTCTNPNCDCVDCDCVDCDCEATESSEEGYAMAPIMVNHVDAVDENIPGRTTEPQYVKNDSDLAPIMTGPIVTANNEQIAREVAAIDTI